MKIAIAQQNYHLGNFEMNIQKIIEAINFAKSHKADLIVFSEMSICGYLPKDFLHIKDFLKQCAESIEKIKIHADTIGVIIGGPDYNTDTKGKPLFNAAFFLYEKKVQNIIHKTCLPTYDIFDEARYFTAATSWDVLSFKGKKIALTICEDMWNLGDHPFYEICPMDILMKKKPDLMINISASPFDYTHAEDRKKTVRTNVKKYGLPLIYCNAVGAQSDIIFDGCSLVFDKNADLALEFPQFQESIQEVILKDDGSFEAKIPENIKAFPEKESGAEKLNPALNIDQIYKALILGIRDYFTKMGFKKALIGSSGGLDSAVTIALACEALGSENVLSVLMPSEYSTSHSVTDAEDLSKNLNSPYEIIPIKNVYTSFLTELEPVFQNKPFGIAEENIQARTRGVILMAISNKLGYILLNTSNKSELAMGYGTLYGDMAGGISVIGDCYKLQVYELANYINAEKEIIPNHIITKPPSAELRPGQKDSDSLPPYEVLDPIIYQFIEKEMNSKEIIDLGFDEAIVKRVWKVIDQNEYKRHQFCPILRVSPKAFGEGRRIPVVAKYPSS